MKQKMEAPTTTTRQEPKEHTVVHFEIPGTDPTKLASFYQQLFGWKFSKWEGPTEYWIIAHKDATENDIMGGLYKRNAPNEQFLNYFLVRSVDESVRKATSLGGTVVSPKQEIPKGYMAVLTDPDGNRFAFFQPTGRM